MDINTILEEFAKANNVKVLWSIESDPMLASNKLIVVFQGEIKRVKAIYLYPKYGDIDYPLLKDRLENLLCELGREEANNG